MLSRSLQVEEDGLPVQEMVCTLGAQDVYAHQELLADPYVLLWDFCQDNVQQPSRRFCGHKVSR